MLYLYTRIADLIILELWRQEKEVAVLATI